MRRCKNCHILPEYTKLPHEDPAEVEHILKCSICGQMISGQTYKAVIRNWGRHNKIKDYYEIIHELQKENSEMRDLIKEFSDGCKNSCPAYNPETCDGCAMNNIRIYGENLKC